jgi:hypothetical protein
LVLQSGETKQDRQRTERVEFLRQLLRRPLEHLLPTQNGSYLHRPLESWSLFDLEHFMTVELWGDGEYPHGWPNGPYLPESIDRLAAASGKPRDEILVRVPLPAP